MGMSRLISEFVISGILFIFLANTSLAQSHTTHQTNVSDAKLNQITPSMVPIPSGRFKMGCVDSSDCLSETSSTRWLEVEAFLMSEHEITWAMYQPCIDSGFCPDNTEDGGDRGWGKGNRPVVSINWYDIVEHYIPWLYRQTGQVYRLPTEVEWEFAARGGTVTAYHWGDDVGIDNANCAGCGSIWDGERSAPVKNFPPNDYGLYDMHGNVWEWTQECWTGLDGEGTPINGEWLPEDCNVRALRSGGFFDLSWSVSVTTKGRKDADRRGSWGFRLVQDLKSQVAE